MNTISPAVNHINNFDFLRLIFATAVLYTHSYPLTMTVDKDMSDILGVFSHGQVQASGIAVSGFFVLSGYLILNSLLRSYDLKDYFFKRIIRVFPALWVVVGICMLGGYFLTNKSAILYFTHPSLYKYALTAILNTRHNTIDGVFEDNPFKQIINGALWTIPYEFLFYILITPLFLLRNKKSLLQLLIPGVLIAFFAVKLVLHKWIYIPFLDMPVSQILNFALLFGAGGMLAIFKLPTTQFRAIFSIAGVLILLVVFRLGGYDIMQYLLLPPLVIYFGTLSYKILGWVRHFGDISYGIYIWGFPIQQVIWHLLHPTQLYMALISIPLVYVVSYISWHLIEKQALKLKRTRITTTNNTIATTESSSIIINK